MELILVKQFVAGAEKDLTVRDDFRPASDYDLDEWKALVGKTFKGVGGADYILLAVERKGA